MDEDEEGLVPEDGHDAGVALEPDKVEDERVDDLVGERVLLVEEYADEETVGACDGNVSWEAARAEERRTGVLHVSELEERGARVEDGDTDFRQDTSDDGGFSEGDRKSVV